jgi:hypothetical protein
MYNTHVNLLYAPRFHSVTCTHIIPGNGTPGYEDGNASAAQFDEPCDIVVHPQTSVIYVADSQNHAIRRIANGDCVAITTAVIVHSVTHP